jgi:hypothetical protein
MSNLRDQIGGLSVAKKIELLDLLWENLETENVPLSEAQSAERSYTGLRGTSRIPPPT